MSLVGDVDILRRIPLFSKVAAARLKLIAYTGDRLQFAPGEVLCREGDAGDSAYVILDGEVDIVRRTDGVDTVIATRRRDDIVGEIALLIGVPRTATVIAKSPLRVLAIAKDVFDTLLEEFPEMAVEMARDLATRLEQTSAELARHKRNPVDG